MNGLYDGFAQNYPVWAMVISTLIAAMSWAFAHFHAEPGTSVSVLWGMATYTRRAKGEAGREKSTKSTPLTNNVTSKDGFLEKCTIPIFLDRMNTKDETYFLISGRWVGAVDHFLKCASIDLRRALLEIISGKRAQFTLEVSTVGSAMGAKYVVGRIENEAFSVSFRNTENEHIRSIERGDVIKVDAKISEAAIFSMDDGIFMELQTRE